VVPWRLVQVTQLPLLGLWGGPPELRRGVGWVGRHVAAGVRSARALMFSNERCGVRVVALPAYAEAVVTEPLRVCFPGLSCQIIVSSAYMEQERMAVTEGKSAHWALLILLCCHRPCAVCSIVVIFVVVIVRRVAGL
jgi:hypothetical protein